MYIWIKQYIWGFINRICFMKAIDFMSKHSCHSFCQSFPLLIASCPTTEVSRKYPFVRVKFNSLIPDTVKRGPCHT